MKIYSDLKKSQKLILREHPKPKPIIVYGAGEWGEIIGWGLYRDYLSRKLNNFYNDPMSNVENGFYINTFVDEKIEKHHSEIEVITPKNLLEYKEKGLDNVIVAIGNNTVRVENYHKLKKMGFKFPTIILSSNNFGGNNNFGEGTVILDNNCFNLGASIGDYNMIYSNNVFSFNSKTEEGVYVTTDCFIGGNVTVGKYSFIGVGAGIKEKEDGSNLKIGEKSFVGMNTFVTKDIPSSNIVFGKSSKFKKLEEVIKKRF
jgi:acetyltransferase-like isoleucine patch superfamily enzyme